MSIEGKTSNLQEVGHVGDVLPSRSGYGIITILSDDNPYEVGEEQTNEPSDDVPAEIVIKGVVPSEFELAEPKTPDGELDRLSDQILGALRVRYSQVLASERSSGGAGRNKPIVISYFDRNLFDPKTFKYFMWGLVEDRAQLITLHNSDSMDIDVSNDNEIFLDLRRVTKASFIQALDPSVENVICVDLEKNPPEELLIKIEAIIAVARGYRNYAPDPEDPHYRIVNQNPAQFTIILPDRLLDFYDDYIVKGVMHRGIGVALRPDKRIELILLQEPDLSGGLENKPSEDLGL